MSSIQAPASQDVRISDAEKNRVFVTMNAVFKDEEKCRTAMETIVNDAHDAHGVHSHFWFRSEDGKSLFVVEQYFDATAVGKAILRFTTARIAFFKSISVTDVSIYGDVSFGIRVAFAPLGPKYMDYYGGFSKNVAEVEKAGIKDFERNRVFVATNANIKQEERVKDVMESWVEDVHGESGTHSHFWAKSKDGEALFVLEQFADEQALVDHLLANSTSRDALLASLELTDVTVYGVKSDKLKETLRPLNPRYMNYYGGYSK